MKKYLIFGIILILSSCGRFAAKKNAIGRLDTVTIIASDYTWGQLENKLVYAVQDTFYFPTREENFEVEWVGYKRMDLHLLEKNLLIVIPYEEDVKGRKFINSILSKEKIDNALQTTKMFSIKDPWAIGQEVIIILGDSLKNIETYLNDLDKKLYWRFYYSVIEREKYFGFYIGHNKGDEERLKKEFHYSMPLPSEYSVVESKNNVVRLVAHFPDRLILITPLKDDLFPDLERAIKIRDSLAFLFYDGDKVVRKEGYEPYLTKPLYEDSLHPAEVLVGLWETADTNKVIQGGGPFFTYFKQFGNKIYMIDCTVWSPGKKKFPSLVNMRYMVEHFYVEKGDSL